MSINQFEMRHEMLTGGIAEGDTEQLDTRITDIELGLLGLMMQRPDSIPLMGFLKPEHFFSDNHREVYEIILAMHAADETITPHTVTAKMQRHPTRSGAYVRHAILESMSVKDPVTDAKLVVEMWRRREIAALCHKQIEKMRDPGRRSEEIVREINFDLEKITTDSATLRFRTDKQVRHEIIADLQKPSVTFSTGIARLDAAMEGGFIPGFNYVFAARKKMGKTTLAGTVSSNLGAAGVRLLYIPAEMSAKEIEQRNISRFKQTSPKNFRNQKRYDPAFRQKIAESAAEAQGNVIYLPYPGIPFAELRAAVAFAVTRYRIQGFVLDSLQLVGGRMGRTSQVDHQDAVAQWCADYGRQHGLFSIITAQINQEGNIRGGEGVRLACDMAFELKAPEDDPSRSTRWMEMIETRYTGWNNVGDPNSPGLVVNYCGPYFHDHDPENPQIDFGENF